MVQREIPGTQGFHDELLLADILLHGRVAVGKTVLVTQAVVNPRCCTALLPGGLSVLLQPFVNDGNEVLRHRIALWLNIRQIVLAPVFLVGVLADSLKAVAGYAGYFPQTCLFIFVEVFDILDLSHS